MANETKQKVADLEADVKRLQKKEKVKKIKTLLASPIGKRPKKFLRKERFKPTLVIKVAPKEETRIGSFFKGQVEQDRRQLFFG